MSAGLKPEHPAARALHDEAGRDLRLGTSEAELRLQCVYAVAPRGETTLPAADLVREAEVLFRYVMGDAAPVSPNMLLELPTAKPAEPNRLWWNGHTLCRTPPEPVNLAEIPAHFPTQQAHFPTEQARSSALDGISMFRLTPAQAMAPVLSEKSKSLLRDARFNLQVELRDIARQVENGEKLKKRLAEIERDLSEPPAT